MLDRALADIVLVVHLAFILFVAFGGALTLSWRWIPALQVPAALWGFFVEISGGVCPLTSLENEFRAAAGSAGYSGGFVEHYLVPVIYPAGYSPQLGLILAAALVVANLLVYGLVRRRTRAARREAIS
jgi:hypothetical protein